MCIPKTLIYMSSLGSLRDCECAVLVQEWGLGAAGMCEEPLWSEIVLTFCGSVAAVCSWFWLCLVCPSSSCSHD